MSRKHETVIVTRHQGLVEYLADLGITGQVLAHVAPADIEGKLVYGVLPPKLAALAWRVVSIPLNVPVELRGVELTKEQVAQYAGRPEVYEVHRKMKAERNLIDFLEKKKGEQK